MRFARIVPAIVLTGIAALSVAQTAQKPKFEVANVKPINPNDSVFVTMSADPSIVRYGNLTLRDAIRGAYKSERFPDRMLPLDARHSIAWRFLSWYLRGADYAKLHSGEKNRLVVASPTALPVCKSNPT